MKIYSYDSDVAKKNGYEFGFDTIIKIILFMVVISVLIIFYCLNFLYSDFGPHIFGYGFLFIIFIISFYVIKIIFKKKVYFICLVKDEKGLLYIVNNNFQAFLQSLNNKRLLTQFLGSDLISAEVNINMINDLMNSSDFNRRILQNEKFVEYFVNHIDEIDGFEVYRILKTNNVVNKKGSFSAYCKAFDLKQNVIFNNLKFEIHKVYKDYEELFNEYSNYDMESANSDLVINTSTEKKYKKTYEKSLEKTKKYVVAMIISTFLGIICLFIIPVLIVVFGFIPTVIYCFGLAALEPLRHFDLNGKNLVNKYIIYLTVLFFISLIIEYFSFVLVF